MKKIGKKQFWLAELDRYGNPTLTDGTHSKISGANQAYNIIKRLNMSDNKKYAIAEITLYEVENSDKGINLAAINDINKIRKKGYK